MSSLCNRAGRSALTGTALAALLALAGCSSFHALLHRHQSVAPAPEPTDTSASPAVDAAPSGEPTTVTDTLGSPDPDVSASTSTNADTTTVVADVGPELKPTAPKSYVVRHGDTLWGIANLFLRDPWSWPEIWYVNPQIANPHRIYPGDELRLATGTNGHTALQLVHATAAAEPVAAAAVAGGAAAARLRPLLRSSALDTPIEAIPYAIIGAFLSHPTVLTSDQIRSAPYVVALAQDHDIAGTGHELFIKQLAGETGSRYSVMHVDEPLINPDNGRQLGYMAIYTGTAELTKPGRISEAVLTDSARETLQGDILIPEERASVADFIPHVPEHALSGRIIAVVDNVRLAGQNQMVAINRGASDGLERGHVLTVDQSAEQVADPCQNIDNSSICNHHPLVTLPTDSAGTLLIIRTYAHLSYALIMSDTVPLQVGDVAHTP